MKIHSTIEQALTSSELTKSNSFNLAKIIEDLELYVSELLKWNKKINLIGKSTEATIWERHILDSLSLLNYVPRGTKIISDFGSGAGIPGIILAIIGRDHYKVHLIESDIRKSAFLSHINLAQNLDLTIHSARIEQLTPWSTDIITARALAPLQQLLTLLQKFCGKTNICLFMKGENVVQEIDKAYEYWDFEYKLFDNPYCKTSKILKIQSVRQRG